MVLGLSGTGPALVLHGDQPLWHSLAPSSHQPLWLSAALHQLLLRSPAISPGALMLSGDHPPLALSGDQPLWSSAILLSHDPIGVHTSFGVSGAQSLQCLAALALWLLALNCLLRSALDHFRILRQAL